MVEDLSTTGELLPVSIIILIVVVCLIEVILKAFALWRAARNDEKTWFVAIFLINSAGILPLIYLFFIAKKDDAHKS